MKPLGALLKREQKEKDKILPILNIGVPVRMIISEEKKLDLAKIGIDIFSLEGNQGISKLIHQLEDIRKDYFIGRIIIFTRKTQKYENSL